MPLSADAHAADMAAAGTDESGAQADTAPQAAAAGGVATSDSSETEMEDEMASRLAGCSHNERIRGLRLGRPADVSF